MAPMVVVGRALLILFSYTHVCENLLACHAAASAVCVRACYVYAWPSRQCNACSVFRSAVGVYGRRARERHV